MAQLNAMDVDDAIMQGDSQADDWMAEIERKYAEPVNLARAAVTWNQVLQRLFPGVPAQMAEQQIRSVDPKAYDSAKKRFMEGMKNGTK